MSQRLLFIFAVLFSVSVLSAYNLYVDASANPQGADGSVIHPYPSIQEAIDHAFDDSLPENAIGPAVVINIASNPNRYCENLTIDYSSHNVRSIMLLGSLTMQESRTIVAEDTTRSIVSVTGNYECDLIIKGLFFLQENDFCNVQGIDLGGQNRFNSLLIEKCVFKDLENAVRISGKGVKSFNFIDSSIIDSVFEVRNNGIIINCPNYNDSVILIKNSVFDSQNHFELTNCRFVDIKLINDTSNLSISSVVNILDNKFKHKGLSMNTSGRSILDANIQGNEFISTGIYMYHQIRHQIRNNIFCNEFFGSAVPAIEYKGGILHGQNRNCSIYGNTLHQYDCLVEMSPIFQGATYQASTRSKIEKNSLIDCTKVLKITRYSNSTLWGHVIDSFRNNLCIVTDPEPFEIVNQQGETVELPENIPVSYSHFVNELASTNSLDLDTETVSYGDPLIMIGVIGSNYTLTWNETEKSPLINAGCPEIDGVIQTDPDGTRPDIGAVYYKHEHRTYFQNNSPLQQMIYWSSFPVIDDRSHTDGRYWNETGMFFSQYIQGAPYGHRLESAAWSYGGYTGDMFFSPGGWQFTTYPITQPKGFKIEFRGTGQGLVPPLWVDGFKANPTQTAIELTHLDANGEVFPNWIGYFVPHTQSVEDAFSKPVPGDPRHTYLDYIYSISTQGWNTSRIENKMGMEWIIPPHRLTLSEGDMVEVKLIRETPLELEEMTWFAFGPSREPYVRPKPEGFIYTELMDYIPIFIEFDPENTPEEVGIFVGDKCYGAAVVDDGIIEVNLYYQPEDEAKNPDDELSFMFYYADKSVKKAPAPLIYNPESLLFETGILKAGQIKNYGYVSYFKGEGSSMVPLLTQLNTNYPNPFREKTKITYILEKESNVTVDIYNLKGQKIKTLYTGFSNKGKHGLNWDATDKHGKKVASGVYFCRLSSPQNIQTQKMLLMK